MCVFSRFTIEKQEGWTYLIWLITGTWLKKESVYKHSRSEIGFGVLWHSPWERLN